MPVLSPHRSSASSLSGSYRSTFSSSPIDRPYFSSSSYNPRLTSYSERYTTRTYTDTDGRRIYSRSGSITEDGITTRFREESREGSVRRDSVSRDSGISSIRENSILDYPRRESSLSRNDSRLSTLNVVDSVAELRNKYSPANYVPAILRKNENISRSKSINDIGLPPIESKQTKKKVNTESLNFNNIGLYSTNNTNNDDNMTVEEDDNGNVPCSVADRCKQFTEKTDKNTRKSPSIEPLSIKISDNVFKKNDLPSESVPAKAKSKAKKTVNGVKLVNNKEKTVNGDVSVKILTDPEKVSSSENLNGVLPNSKFDVKNTPENKKSAIASEAVKNEIIKKEKAVANGTSKSGNSRVNDCASYIPNNSGKEIGSIGDSLKVNGAHSCNEKNLVENGDSTTANTATGESIGKVNMPQNDITTSPKLTRSTVSPSNSTSASNNTLSRRTRDYDDDLDNGIGGRSPYSASMRPLSSSPVKTLGLNGLKNIGNTCFMNSVIQCLSNTRQLMEYLRKDEYVRDVNTSISSMKGALIKAFAEVIKELWSEDASDRVVNTTSLKSQIQRFAPRFMGYAQQDAQEFLRYLLEGLHEDVNRVTEKPKPILTEIDEKLSDNEKSAESWSRYLRMDNSRIVDVFVGQLKSTLKCTHCNHSSVTFDPFWDLSLPIPQRTGQLRLSQCLESFTREETLDGDEKPTCSKCKERRKCTKSFSIQKFPKILVIHLKRFSPTERFRGKLNVNVDFPLEGLDMSNYAADSIAPCRYNLYAISNHSGTTYSGHYTAYCRHPYTYTWHEYNDSRVSSISSKSIVSGEAYVLFYEQEGQKSHL